MLSTALLSEFLKNFERFKKEDSFYAFDACIYSLLNIFNQAFYKKQLITKISLKLGFLLNRNAKSFFDEASIKDNFFAIEQQLDPKLRGFSRLLEVILDEYEIKADPKNFLMPIKSVSEKIYQTLLRLFYSLMTYEKIEKNFNRTSMNVAVSLFLKAMVEIDENTKNSIVLEWMRWRRHRADLINLFQDICNIENIDDLKKILKNRSQITFEAIFFLTCLKSEHALPLANKEQKEFDEIAKIAGFCSIADLKEIALFMDCTS